MADESGLSRNWLYIVWDTEKASLNKLQTQTHMSLKWSLRFRFFIWNVYHTCYMACWSYSPRYHRSNNISWKDKLLSSFISSLGSRYSHQYVVLKHTQYAEKQVTWFNSAAFLNTRNGWLWCTVFGIHTVDFESCFEYEHTVTTVAVFWVRLSGNGMEQSQA
jgi:hypothetical protein